MCAATLCWSPRPALFEAVLGELRLAATPVLVVIEDAHWADDATLDLLKFLGRRIERTRALLVVSFRDDEAAASHPLRRVIGELPGTALQLHMLRNADADAASRRAIELLESLPPSAALAVAYGIEASLRMLNRDCAESVEVVGAIGRPANSRKTRIAMFLIAYYASTACATSLFNA